MNKGEFVKLKHTVKCRVDSSNVIDFIIDDRIEYAYVYTIESIKDNYMLLEGKDHCHHTINFKVVHPHEMTKEQLWKPSSDYKRLIPCTKTPYNTL
jgi:hypothetical protein